MTDQTAGFDTGALFQGSARLGLLLGALEIPWEQVAPFVAAFPGELSRYQELSLDDQDAGLGLMTRGEGADFTHRVAHFMEARGVAEEPLRRLLVTARYFEHKGLFFKVEAGAAGIEELSWYVRRRPSLPVARAWLAQAGVGHEALDLFERVALALDKRTVHFLAASERPGGGSTFKAYFSQPDSSEAFARLEAAARLCGLGERDIAPLNAHFPELAARTAFFSLSFAEGAALPGAKIDIHDLDPAVVARIAVPAAAERFALLLQTMGRERADYAGFRLRPGEGLHTRIYATREG